MTDVATLRTPHEPGLTDRVGREVVVVDVVAILFQGEVVDPLTIKLSLKAPFSPLLAQLTDRAGMMVSPKAAEAAGDKFGLKPVCAGPYKFVERVQQDRIVVEKFADYWNKDNIFIDKITYLPIVDGTVRLANLRSGGLDMIERVLATDIKTVRDTPKLERRRDRVFDDRFGTRVGVHESIHERSVRAVLEQPPHEIRQQVLVAPDGRVDAATPLDAGPSEQRRVQLGLGPVLFALATR